MQRQQRERALNHVLHVSGEERRSYRQLPTREPFASFTQNLHLSALSKTHFSG